MRAESAYTAGDAPIESVEGFVRQIMGWRDYVWHLYWQQGEPYRRRNALSATGAVPKWFASLDEAGTVAGALPVRGAAAACASTAGCTTSRG